MEIKQRRRLSRRPYIKKILMLLLCFVLLSSALSPACAAAGEETANNRTVKAGVFFFDGYHMRDDDGNYSGYGIELLNLISQYSHLNFEFVGYDNTWEDMQQMLLSGEIDVVTSARRTRARTEVFGFSDPIENNSTVLSVLQDNTSLISGDYSTYEGMTVGLLSGSSQNRTLPLFAEENGFTYNTREYEDSGMLEAALKRGEIDAILSSNLRRMDGERILDTTKIDYFYAITRKDDRELLDEINYALSQMNLHEGNYWANNLYEKYYGSGVSYADDLSFTQRELDYIEAVKSGEKHITVTGMPGRKPYCYAEDGELKGIQPRFFDRLMKLAGLPYEMIVPGSDEEYEQLKNSSAVDIVIDWQQTAFTEKEYISEGFLTNVYMDTGVALITRRDHSGPISSLGVLDGLVGLPLEHEQFENTGIVTFSSQQELLRAVLNEETDAAFMRTYAAQYYVNNDRTKSLQMSIIDSDQVAFKMFIDSRSDHELVTILNKCIQLVPGDVLTRLIAEYTARSAANLGFIQYLSANPEMTFALAAVGVLAIAVILFFYLRARWNNQLLHATEESRNELEEQFALVNALSRDYITVYKLDLKEDTIQPLKLEGDTVSGWDWKRGETVPFTDTMFRYLEGQVPAEDKDDLKKVLSLERIRQALSASPEYSGTFRILLREEIHNFQFTCVAYQAQGQAEPRVLLGFRNIDEIVREEQQQKTALTDALNMAQTASEAKTAFLSNMSHDIRTPMNAIIGFLTLMRDETDNPEAVMEYIERIDSASQHLLGLINDVLDMNKIESGSTTLSLAEMDLAEIITEINLIIQPQADAKNQTFGVFVSHLNHEHLLGDKMRLNQILINLLSNSVKYTPEYGEIEMRVEELPQVVDDYSRIRFTIRDNGLGMSEDYLKVIFEPFTREETKSTFGIQGTGLGMAITKSLVDLMGGSIRVESKLGEGSTFTVELELPIREQEEDNARFWADNRIARILVVDDDEEFCHNVVQIMSGTGVSTDYAVSGGDAVGRVRRVKEAGASYDLILLDWKMPGMSGLETAQLIRRDSGSPILLMTAYDWRDIEQDALKVGVSHFMPKPFFLSTFKEAVGLMMGRAKEAGSKESDVVKGMHILVVDDIDVNRIILVKILSTMGAECDTAADGQEAVEKFMSASPEYGLILMDVQMPVMNGYEATKAIRSSGHPLAGTVPIVAMTANAFVDDVREAIESGMDAHIAKPVQIDKLKSTLQQVLDSRAEQ